jgi:hypothetical protein
MVMPGNLDNMYAVVLTPSTKTMGRRAISEKQRLGLLDAFRAQPGGLRSHFALAGKAAGVDWRTAKRAWETGWPDFPPVREQLAEQQVRARAEMSVEVLRAKAAAAPALAAEDAAQSAAREAMLARGAREVALSFLTTVGPLHKHMKALSARVQEGGVEGLSPGEALSQMKDAVAVVAKVVELGQRAVQMERLRLGDPTAIVGIRAMPVADVTLEAAEAEAAAVQRSLARLKLVGGADADAR